MAALSDLQQSVRLRSRHRIKNYGLDQAINRRAASDAKRECEYGHACETGILAQHPHSVTNVLPEGLQHRQTTLIAIGFLRGFDSPQFDHRPTARFFGRHPQTEIVIELEL